MIIIKGIAASPGISIGKAYVARGRGDRGHARRDPPRPSCATEVARFKAAQKATHRDLDAAEAEGPEAPRQAARQAHRRPPPHPAATRLITQDVPKRILSRGRQRGVRPVRGPGGRQPAVREAGRRVLPRAAPRPLRRRQAPAAASDEAHQQRSLAEIDHAVHPDLAQPAALRHLGLKETKIIGFATDLGGKTSPHRDPRAEPGDSRRRRPVRRQPPHQDRRHGDPRRRAGHGDHRARRRRRSPSTRRSSSARSAEEKSLEALKGLPTVTLDGRGFRLEANLDSPEELKSLVALQPDGIGLFRTEYLFLNRTDTPSEDEQSKAYAAVVKAMDGREVVIRTADIGGRPALAARHRRAEERDESRSWACAACGCSCATSTSSRRSCGRSCAPSTKGKVRVMIPMVSSVGEVLADAPAARAGAVGARGRGRRVARRI